MEQVAFALREQYQPQPDDEGVEQNPDAMHGGSVTLPDGASYDVAEAISDDDDGLIVTDDPNIAGALAGFSPLKRVPVPEDRKLENKPLARRTKAELVLFAAQHRVELDEGATKDRIVEQLQEAGVWTEDAEEANA